MMKKYRLTLVMLAMLVVVLAACGAGGEPYPSLPVDFYGQSPEQEQPTTQPPTAPPIFRTKITSTTYIQMYFDTDNNATVSFSQTVSDFKVVEIGHIPASPSHILYIGETILDVGRLYPSQDVTFEWRPVYFGPPQIAISFVDEHGSQRFFAHFEDARGYDACSPIVEIFIP